MATRETAAVSEIGTLNQAQLQYFAQFQRYAASLAELGPGAANLIPASLAEGKKGGYRFTMTGSPEGYTINAHPTQFGGSGRRTFFSDQTLMVRFNDSAEPATTGSPELGTVK